MYHQWWPNTPDPPVYYPFYPNLNTQPNYDFQFNYWFTCPHCGASITGQGAYCPHCGKKLSDTPKTTLDDIKKLLEELNKKFDSLSETVTTKEESI